MLTPYFIHFGFDHGVPITLLSLGYALKFLYERARHFI